MPTVINVDIDITFLEALSKFKVNYELDDFVVLNVAKQTGSPFRYVKFIYSEKATKFCEMSTLLLFVCTVDKSKVIS